MSDVIASLVDGSGVDGALSEVAQAAIRGGFARRGGRRIHLERMRSFVDGKAGVPDVPEGANEELETIAATSVLNMAGPVKDAFVHGLSVVGFRSPAAQDDESVWSWWQSQGLDARQHEVHDATCTYGWSFVSVLPEGSSKAEARIWSPLDVDAVYEDARHDRFPVSATLWRKVDGGWSVL